MLGGDGDGHVGDGAGEEERGSRRETQIGGRFSIILYHHSKFLFLLVFLESRLTEI